MDEIIDTSGFYKRDGDNVLFGPNFVLNASYELRRETHDSHSYPVDGWLWFDSAEAAYAAFGLVMSVDVSEQPPTDALERLGLHLSAEPETV